MGNRIKLYNIKYCTKTKPKKNGAIKSCLPLIAYEQLYDIIIVKIKVNCKKTKQMNEDV